VNQTHDHYDVLLITHLQEQIHNLWLQEEQYWTMRSRINWLRWGDKNTKFYHATTIQRRQHNKINMLQDDNQVWVRDPQLLKQMTTYYFSTLYQTMGHRDYGPILNQCPRIITEEMNLSLTAPVTKEEVQHATFQLGKTKAPGPDSLNGLFYQNH